MLDRRKFIGGAAAGVAATASAVANDYQPFRSETIVSRPIVISTWRHGLAANDAAWKILSAGGRALDAVEAGVRVSESDPKVSSVGYGGWPDASGVVTLDACIMNETGDCGSVACLQDIENPISVARMVMEKTPHVMMVGSGAKDFAIRQGVPTKNLLTDSSKQAWEKWKANHPDALKSQTPNIENHDTIGMVAVDSKGQLSGACTTSGLAWKLPGRVGDSPIIGAGLYVDNEIGAATATGVGEAVIRAVGCFLVVELMRQGNSPQEACRLAVERVAQKNPNWKEFQVGFVAVNKQGETGAYALQGGFDYAVYDQERGNHMNNSSNKLDG